ncbi:MAG TPA: NAD-dependent epimerase/dehydratase family protein [Elusimicrobiota bacterium]|nr:NAD-dependent epimerase/dehydratase family protein [Elusimicrobiota bacterium]
MTKVLVTGGTGFIGSFLVKRLVDKGYAVRVFDNNFRGSLSKLGDYAGRVEILEGDICDPKSVDKATEGMDWVFHLAFINGTRHFYEIPHKVLEVGIHGALNTVESAIRHKIKRYIVASSAEVYQEPTHVPTTEKERLIIPDITNPRYSYGGGKIVCELLALHMGPKHGLHTVVFRPHNVYGPDMGEEHVVPQFIRRMQNLSKSGKGKLRFPIQGSGQETRAFCYVDDVVNGVVLCGEKGLPSQIYHIGNDHEITIAEVAQKIALQLGLKLDLQTGEMPTGSTPRRCPSIQKARTDLGYDPTVSLDEGLQRTCDWYCRHLA